MSQVPDEQWMPLFAYPGYEVSSLGRVRSVTRVVETLQGRKTYRGRVLRQSLSFKSSGASYMRVAVKRVDGSYETRHVHTLVLEGFVGPRPDRNHARHLNGNPVDNHLANLAWGTVSENMYDKVRHGRDHNASKTHCPQGHPYDAENTYYQPSRGHRGRLCRKCNRAHDKASKLRKRVSA
jgi:hypothetical protein